MQAILLDFGDNDFFYTWEAVFNSVLTTGELFKIKDKKKLAFILSQAAWGMYVLHQNRCRYNGLEKFDESYVESMRKYFTVKPRMIKLDDEVKSHLEKGDGWYNGEIFVIYEGDPTVYNM